MRIFDGFHHEGKLPVIITVEYDEELEIILVEVTRGYDTSHKTFEPNHEPKDGKMHISDVEKSVKLANVLIKELKKTAQRSKK